MRKLTSRERRCVERALRGPIGRGDLSAASIERRLVEVLPPDVVAMVVARFARRPALTSLERRRLAAAIRGPIPRFDLSASSLERRLASLPPDVRALLVEAFAARPRRHDEQLRLF